MWIVISVVYAEVPVGLCFALVGFGALIDLRHPPVTDTLMILGLISGAVGILLIFWHPNWLRPTWLRGPFGD